MAKSDEVFDPAVKNMYKMLDAFIYKYDASTVWTDWLVMAVSQFGTNWEEDHTRAMSRYDDDDKKQLGKIFYEWIKVLDQEIQTDKDWFDPLGEIYMALSSQSKQKGFGQFFTPAELCNICAIQTTGGGDQEGNCQDPASGSARMILAMKVLNPRMHFYAIDKDYTCALMSALNMATHGCQGEVLWADTLMPDWETAQVFEINKHPLHYKSGVPTIFKIEDIKQSFSYQAYESMIVKKQIAEEPTETSVQLNLF